MPRSECSSTAITCFSFASAVCLWLTGLVQRCGRALAEAPVRSRRQVCVRISSKTTCNCAAAGVWILLAQLITCVLDWTFTFAGRRGFAGADYNCIRRSKQQRDCQCKGCDDAGIYINCQCKGCDDASLAHTAVWLTSCNLFVAVHDVVS